MPVSPYLSQEMSPKTSGDFIPPPLRTLGVHKASNHTARSQLEGWRKTIDSCCDLLSRSPLGQNLTISTGTFIQKLRCVLTDHASDQKLMFELLKAWKERFDYESRGIAILEGMSEGERIQALSEHLEVACKAIGCWESLSEDQQTTTKHNTWLALTLATGEEAFQLLNKDERQDAHLLFWNGCAMHKEMNAVKGGASSMASAWIEKKLTPPIPLRNKADTQMNANHLKLNSTELPPQKHDTSRGAVKLTSLVGAVVNNKIDKIGQQDTFR